MSGCQAKASGIAAEGTLQGSHISARAGTSKATISKVMDSPAAKPKPTTVVWVLIVKWFRLAAPMLALLNKSIFGSDIGEPLGFHGCNYSTPFEKVFTLRSHTPIVLRG
jgi:hypothetical protein